MTTEEKRIIDGLLARDPKITCEFFYKKCRPMFHGIIHEVFRDSMDYDDLINEFYVFLMDKDGRRLKTFGTADAGLKLNDREAFALLAWIRKSARRYFIHKFKQEQEQLEKYENSIDSDGEPIEVEHADESQEEPWIKDDLETLLSLTNPKDRDILKKYFIQDMDAEEISAELGISLPNLYNIKSRALKRLEKLARHAAGPGSLCAIVCEQYALDSFGIHKSLYALTELAREKGWIEETGMSLDNFGKISSFHGLKVLSGLATFEDLVYALDKDKQVIVAVDGGELTGNPIEERLEDAFAGEVSDHTVVVLTIDESAGEVCLYDPACGPMPLTVELDRFIDAWDDSGNFALIVQR